jgi:hypothetical protein
MVVGRETRWWPFIVWLWQAQQVPFNRQQVGQGTGSILGLARSTRFNFQRSLARSGSSSILKFEKFHGSKPGCHTTRYVHTGTCIFVLVSYHIRMCVRSVQWILALLLLITELRIIRKWIVCGLVYFLREDVGESYMHGEQKKSKDLWYGLRSVLLDWTRLLL